MHLYVCQILLLILTIQIGLSGSEQSFTIPLQRKCEIENLSPGHRAARSVPIDYTGVMSRCKFFIALAIGRSGKPVDLMLDTGATLSWSLTNNDYPKLSNYQPSYGAVTGNFGFVYGSCSIEFKFYKEEFNLPSDDLVDLTPTIKLAFGGISKEHNPCEQILRRTHGILSLAPLQKDPDFPANYVFLQQVYEGLENQMFAIWVSSETNNGLLSLGKPLKHCYKNNKYDKKVKVKTLNKLAPSQLSGSWRVKGNLVVCLAGGMEKQQYSDMTFFLDTGVNRIVLPDYLALIVKNSIKKRNKDFTWENDYEEEILEVFPTFTIQFSNTIGSGSSPFFQLKPKNYIYKRGSIIRPGLQERKQDEITLGSKFFEIYYTEFFMNNRSDDSIFIAVSKPVC